MRTAEGRLLIFSLFLLVCLFGCQNYDSCRKGNETSFVSPSIYLEKYPIPRKIKCSNIKDEIDALPAPGTGEIQTASYQCGRPQASLPYQSDAPNGSNIQNSWQERDVSEGDFVAEDEEHLYIARQTSIELLDKTTGKSLSTYQTSGLHNTRLYIQKHRLVAVSKSRTQTPTTVRIYDRHKNTLQLLQETAFQGNLLASRIIDDRLILITQGSLDGLSSTTEAKSSPMRDSDCGDIYLDLAYRTSNPLTTIIHEINLSSGVSKATTLIHANQSYDFYVTSKAIYLYSRLLNSTAMRKVSLGEKTTKLAHRELIGMVPSRWALKELDHDHLSVVSSSFDPNLRTRVTSLQVLRQSGDGFTVIGLLSGIAPDEEIRAVRYIGSHAYVVTFQKVDPIHAIDLSKVEQPRLIGHLEVPGFSTHLQPLNADLMFGVGFGTIASGRFSWFNNLQLSLFGIKNPSEIVSHQQIEVGERGSYSDAAFDAHALLYDMQTKTLALPVVEVGWLQSPSLTGTSKVDLWSGAHFYRLQDDLELPRLELFGRASHSDLVPETCRKQQRNEITSWQYLKPSHDINRIKRVGKLFFSISRFGLRSHPVANPSAINHTIVWTGNEAECLQVLQHGTENSIY